MTLLAYLFLRVRPAKNVVRYISKKSRFRLPFQKKHGKRVSTLFKFERQHLYHIYWSTGMQFSCKKSLLVICKSLRLFLNTMSAVDKCSLPNRNNLMQPIHKQLSQKLKFFSPFFQFIFEILGKFWTFSKKEWRSYLIYFWGYGLRKTWLDICLKSPASDNPSKTNMANESQLCLNLSDNTCIIFIDQRECSLVVKSLF